MNFFEIWKSVVVDNYANFEGRARRSEYWGFVLVNSILILVLNVIDIIIFGIDSPLRPLASLCGLMMFLPNLAVAVRRLHDVGKSGWTMLFGLIPLLGSLYLIYLFALDGERTENQYGQNPKASEE